MSDLLAASTFLTTKWKLPVPENNRGLYDVVLGVSIKDFNVETIEAVIVTVEQNIRGFDNYKSEVRTIAPRGKYVHQGRS